MSGGPIRPVARIVAHLAVLFALVFAAPSARTAADDDAAGLLERRVKAALIYRLTNYVEWPESAFADASSAFGIGIAGADLIAAELTEFAAGRRVLNRPLTVRRRAGRADAFKGVQLVFIGRDESAQLASIIRAAPRNALIVTESENALQLGSVVNFVIVDGQVRFEVSLEAAQKRNLRLSSRLLSVAQAVHPGAP
jgi:hypothetical protein